MPSAGPWPAAYHDPIPLTLENHEPTLRRLEGRAEREKGGVVTPASRLLDEAAERDPDEFIGSTTGGELLADDIDRALERHDFGTARS